MKNQKREKLFLSQKNCKEKGNQNNSLNHKGKNKSKEMKGNIGSKKKIGNIGARRMIQSLQRKKGQEKLRTRDKLLSNRFKLVLLQLERILNLNRLNNLRTVLKLSQFNNPILLDKIKPKRVLMKSFSNNYSNNIHIIHKKKRLSIKKNM